jgi:isoleucyl-tRNA synthetase
LIYLFIQDPKKEPAYGADVLRMWASTVEYGSDSPIGPAVLAQCMESLRKLRNSARFILGNVDGKRSWSDTESLSREEMGLVRHLLCVRFPKIDLLSIQAERYMMHELYKLEQTALESYRAYNFSRGNRSFSILSSIGTQVHHQAMTALINFANITLSSFYFDITKDCLYADSMKSLERRSVIKVLAKVTLHCLSMRL